MFNLCLQISGFIDLAHRIKKENFLPYLTGQKHLKPRAGDLSFANLTKRKSRLCSSDNWRVMSEDCGQPAINFVHSVTCTKVSTIMIEEDDTSGDTTGWKEIKTGDRNLKIMCFDESLS